MAQGKTVAVLDNGDPLVYGPCSWSLTELRDLDTEVVPGLSCFNAANAALKAGVTEGKSSHSVILASGWSVDEMAVHQNTMVLFTMRTQFKKFIDSLSAHYPADTPVAIVISAGYVEKERVMRGTLETILDQVGEDRLPFEYLLYVGDFLSKGEMKTKSHIILLFTAVWLIVLCAPVLAHNLWLNPDNYFPDVGTTVDIGIGWGHKYPANRVDQEVKDGRVKEIKAVDPDGKTIDLSKVSAALYQLKIDKPGAYLVTARIKPGFFTTTTEGRKWGNKKEIANPIKCTNFHIQAKTVRMRTIFTIIAISMLTVSTGWCHGVEGSVDQVKAYCITAQYDDGEPMSYAAVEIKAPQSETAFQTGRTDRNGCFMVKTDAPGVWQAVVKDGMGHRLDLDFTPSSDGDGPPTDKSPAPTVKRQMSRPMKVVAGVSIIFGVCGFLYGWKARHSIQA